MLTTKQVTGLKPKSKPYYVWDSNGERGTGKLGVQITPKGSKRFTFRYFVGGKAKFIPIGAFPDVSLSDAREKQRELGGLLVQGIDPKAHFLSMEDERREQELAEQSKGSLEQLINGYVAKLHLDGKRSGDRILKAMERDVYSSISKTKKAKDITPTDIKILLAKMIQRGAPVQANKVRAYLHAAFNFGLKHDNDPANMSTNTIFGIEYNPVTAVPKQTHAERVGENWLKLHEIKQLISEADENFKPDISILIKLCIFLGGQRPFELMASKWEAVDFDGRTFEIQASVSKNYRPNLIPLTETAYNLFYLLKQCQPESDYLFPRSNAMGHLDPVNFSKLIRDYCKRTGFRKFVPRDLRRTAKTLMGELGLSKEIRDRLQNHALNDVSSKHYDRYEYLPEKRRALEAWEQKLNETESSNVLMFGSGYER
ncbi:integrase arm-type DNA-binding domain-containing protein [Vibrio fluvialis]|uniref:tyrosine-type recombinase/integrase n=1 Tax=Vibrio fluvialis TaxID=676 RepID=UPI0027E402C7|nr:integrase arm-type DNA-binding domain-containing protein [Vibrio fluvialis]WMN54837.1 integrase arm-type DNA-binding domain-containing protein [Vibrio fluvialis]